MFSKFPKILINQANTIPGIYPSIIDQFLVIKKAAIAYHIWLLATTLLRALLFPSICSVGLMFWGLVPYRAVVLLINTNHMVGSLRYDKIWGPTDPGAICADKFIAYRFAYNTKWQPH